MNTAFKAALISAALTAVAAPAFAQDFNRDHRDHRGGGYSQQGFARTGFDLFQRIDQLQNRVDRARDNRSISRQEARRANEELRDIRSDLQRATRGRNHLTPAMHARFDNRIDRVGFYVRDARNDDHHGRPHRRG